MSNKSKYIQTILNTVTIPHITYYIDKRKQGYRVKVLYRTTIDNISQATIDQLKSLPNTDKVSIVQNTHFPYHMTISLRLYTSKRPKHIIA